jgi:lipopolysaccharide/colanic/teichoic acid biosynthesis glycosyltransferase
VFDDDPLMVQDGHSAARSGTELVLASDRMHRILDLAAAVTVVILLAPILLVTAIAIKLDSDGPIFIREPKFGHGNRKIQLFKFRLMSACRDGNTRERPTRIGQILSETGIDEVPLLFNVMRGELSIVGPSASSCFNPLLNEVKPGVIQWRGLL